MKHGSHRPNDDRSGLHAMVGRRARTGLLVVAVLGVLSLAGCGTVAGAGTHRVTFASEFMGDPKDVRRTLTLDVTTDANDQIVSVVPVA